MKNRKPSLILAGALFLLLTIESRAAREGAAAGLDLVWQLLLPSLLPFFTAAGLLNRLGFTHAIGRRLHRVLGRALGTSGYGCSVFLLGLSGGYPLGAVTLGELLRSGQLEAAEARRLYAFCDNTGPAFAVGAVGAAFASTKAGLFLWGTHAASALILGMLLPGKIPAQAAKPPHFTPESPAQAFTGAVQSALRAMGSITGYVVFFGALLGILRSWGIIDSAAAFLARGTGVDGTWWRCLITGILELSSAVGQMQKFPCTRLNLALGAFLLSWGGLCIHFQSLAVIQGTALNGKERLRGKLLQGVLSGILAYGFAPMVF